MADIIKFPGPKRLSKEQLRERINFSKRFTDTLFFLNNLVKTDSDTHNPKNIAERRKTLEEWSDDDLKREILTGDGLKWKEKPSWYFAVIEELNHRGLLSRPKS